MFSLFKSRATLFVLFALPLFLAIQGCNERDGVATIASIGILGGGISVGVYDDYYYDCNGYYGCGYYDRYGYYHGRSYSRGYYDRYGRWHRTSVHSSDAQEQQVTEDLNNTASVAAHYGLSMEAASTLKKTLRSTVETQSLQPVYNLGLSSTDLYSISQNREISQQGLQNLSGKLGLTAEQTRAAVSKMTADAHAARSL